MHRKGTLPVTNDSKEELLNKIIALIAESTVPYGLHVDSVKDGKIYRSYPHVTKEHSHDTFRHSHLNHTFRVDVEAELVRMKIWAAKVRTTADLIDDVVNAWEILKIPTELNKLEEESGLPECVVNYLIRVFRRGEGAPAERSWKEKIEALIEWNEIRFAAVPEWDALMEALAKCGINLIESGKDDDGQD